jgi:hypothetical protein
MGGFTQRITNKISYAATAYKQFPGAEYFIKKRTKVCVI